MAKYATTSATNVTPAIEEKTFTVAAGLQYLGGEWIKVVSASTFGRYMTGTVLSYSGTSLVIDVDGIGEVTSAATDWNINLAGPRGAPGANGTGAVSTVNDQAPDGAGNVVVPFDAFDIDPLDFTPLGYTPRGPNPIQHLGGISDALESAATNPNLLINGDGMIKQRVFTTVADDTYHIDRWYALTQSNPITPSQITDVIDGVPNMIRLTQSHATAQRMGSAQIIEAPTSKPHRGKKVTLSGQVRLSATSTVNVAVLAWTGTADGVTSDVVNSWTNGTLTAGNFFIGANLTVASVQQVAVTANVLAAIDIKGIDVPSGCNNLIVFVWTNSAVAQSVTLDYWLKLERGAVVTPFVREPYYKVLDDCLWYTRLISTPVLANIADGFRQTTNIVSVQLIISGEMRSTPSFSHSSPAWVAVAPSGNQIAAYNYNAAGFITITGALSLIFTGGPGAFKRFYASAATSFSGNAGDTILFQMGASAWLLLDAEL